MLHNDLSELEAGHGFDDARAAAITVEPYPHQVRIVLQGLVLAQTRSALLYRDGYAPDIYIPREDVSAAHVFDTGPGPFNPYKQGTPVALSADTARGRHDDIAWIYPQPEGWPELAGHVAFAFNAVETYVDGARVRGHVRDPHKTITVSDLDARLALVLNGVTVAETDRAMVLRETGLPARYYLPPEDVDPACLAPSDRQTVCTYKGEAIYHHLTVGETRHDNAVWAYPAPWLDFQPDLARIKGYLGVYASHFDAVLVDGVPAGASDADADADRAMIASPTVDAVLAGQAGPDA